MSQVLLLSLVSLVVSVLIIVVSAKITGLTISIGNSFLLALIPNAVMLGLSFFGHPIIGFFASILVTFIFAHKLTDSSRFWPDTVIFILVIGGLSYGAQFLPISPKYALENYRFEKNIQKEISNCSEYISDDSLFKIAIPKVPEKKNSVIETKNGYTLNITNYTADSDLMKVDITHTDFGVEFLSSEQTLLLESYEKTIEGYFPGMKITNLKSTSIESNYGNPGIELLFVVDYKNRSFYCKAARFVLPESTVDIIAIIENNVNSTQFTQISDKLLDKVFSSFQLQ